MNLAPDKPFPDHWGPTPYDKSGGIVDSPYGKVASNWAEWIKKHLDADKATINGITA